MICVLMCTYIPHRSLYAHRKLILWLSEILLAILREAVEVHNLYSTQTNRTKDYFLSVFPGKI